MHKCTTRYISPVQADVHHWSIDMYLMLLRAG